MSLRRSEEGFTIIELLIATAVLSTILVLVTVLMISIGNLYYKGVNQARVQDDVRTISDEVAQHLQYSSQSPATSNPADSNNTFAGIVLSAYCIDNTRYTFITGVQDGKVPPGKSVAVQHVLWRDTIPSGAACLAVNLTSTAVSPTDKAGNGTKGVELISAKSRLTNFSIAPVTSPYTVSVGVAYGDDDLLINPNASNAHCRGSIGDQFCATASLQTTVVKRLTNDSL